MSFPPRSACTKGSDAAETLMPSWNGKLSKYSTPIIFPGFWVAVVTQKSLSPLQWAKRLKPSKGFSHSSEVGLGSMIHTQWEIVFLLLQVDSYINQKSQGFSSISFHSPGNAGYPLFIFRKIWQMLGRPTSRSEKNVQEQFLQSNMIEIPMGQIEIKA